MVFPHMIQHVLRWPVYRIDLLGAPWGNPDLEDSELAQVLFAMARGESCPEFRN